MNTFETDLTGPDDVIPEETTRFLSFQLQKADGTGIPSAELGSFTLTLFDRRTRQILNQRDGVDVLNANGGTVDSQGNAVIELVPADNIVFTAGRTVEDHGVLFEWAYQAGTRTGRHVVWLRVQNLVRVP